MNAILTEILIIILLILANGFLAMAELALVSVRKIRFRKLAEAGDERAKAALELIESPSRFLSTVQVGITLIGVLAGAFGGATLAEAIATRLKTVPAIGAYGDAIGVATVVRFLGMVTDVVLRLCGVRTKGEPPVTKDEVRALVEQGQRSGTFVPAEKELVEHALALETQRAADLMTSGSRVVWLNLADADEVNWRKIVGSGHSYFPVYDRTHDQIRGIVSVKALWANLALAGTADLRNLLVKPLFVPETMGALKLLESFKQSRMHVALVTDEFGGVQGLVTIVDVLEELVGEFPAFDERRDLKFVRRADGSWLVDGSLEIEELRRELHLKEMPEDVDEGYRTVAGLVLSRLQRIPREGDSFEAFGHRFEVADMDRHRVDKVIVQQHRKTPAPDSRDPIVTADKP